MTTKTRRAPNRTATRKPPPTAYAQSKLSVDDAHAHVRGAWDAGSYVEALAHLRSEVDSALGHAVARMRFDGASWAEIGDRLGITHQGARQRFATVVAGDFR